jgi:hypothetical protein
VSDRRPTSRTIGDELTGSSRRPPLMLSRCPTLGALGALAALETLRSLFLIG